MFSKIKLWLGKANAMLLLLVRKIEIERLCDATGVSEENLLAVIDGVTDENYLSGNRQTDHAVFAPKFTSSACGYLETL